MERERKLASRFMWIMATGLLFQGLVTPVMSIRFEDQKHYYSPNPHDGTPPRGSHGSPPHGYGGSPPTHHGSPPHNNYPTPSTPPSNCGNPPHEPVTPTTPSNPPSGGGGYYHSPPSGGYNPPPGGDNPPPVIVSPPYDPGTPSIPTPPFSPVPGTCTYWSTHPTLIWGVLGWWGSLGSAFGVTSIPGFGANMSLQQALSNTHTDGYGALYREGTASWLNSLVNHRFPFTTDQVRQSFVAALHSDRAAAAQAQLFKLANEGHLKPRA